MRKMIIRADDIGHSKVCNLGTFEAIENGIVTAANVMLDSPGTEDALERLKAYPWISVGWHMHMWGAPVSDPKRVPSLVEKDGQFAGRFRTDLAASDVNFDQAVTELRAQLDRCLKILGRVPLTGGDPRDTPWGKAAKQVMAEYGMATGFGSRVATDPRLTKRVLQAKAAGEKWAEFYPAEPSPATKADEKWASRKLVVLDGNFAYMDLYTDSISSVETNYDPVRYYTEDRAGILNYPEDVTVQQAWHPGFVDYYVYRLGERVNRPRAQQFVVSRTQDCHAMQDPRLRNWIKEHKIELVNTRDVLFGTREYQNHLRQIGSDLAIG